MSPAAELVFARLIPEEGERNEAYDDATGRTIKAPVGNLTWGRGFCLVHIASKRIFDVIERELIAMAEEQLLKLDWYVRMTSVRQSVFLDVAYNAGLTGLLHGFPKMCAAAAAKDWQTCAAECTVSDARLDKTRYAPLRELLRNGDTTP